MDLETIIKQLEKANVTDTFGTKKEIKALPEIINDDETILYATSGFFKGNTVLIVCTDSRILFIDKGLIYGVKSYEVPLDMVNGVSYSIGLVFGKVSVVNGAITNEIDNIDKKTVSILADTIKKAANDYKNKLKQSTISTNANINTTDPDSITQLLNINSEILHELRAIRHLLEKNS